MQPQQLPGARDMAFCGLQITDRKPDHGRIVEAGMREEDLSGFIDAIDECRVEPVECRHRQTGSSATGDRR